MGIFTAAYLDIYCYYLHEVNSFLMHIFHIVCFCIFQLQLAVYYESLCPDSARFIVEQLQPLKRSPLGKYVDVTLVPFGKANVSIYLSRFTYISIGS